MGTINRLHFFVLYCFSVLSSRANTPGAGATGCSYVSEPLSQQAGRWGRSVGEKYFQITRDLISLNSWVGYNMAWVTDSSLWPISHDGPDFWILSLSTLLIDYCTNFETVVTSNILDCMYQKDINILAWLYDLSISASEWAINSKHWKRTSDVIMYWKNGWILFLVFVRRSSFSKHKFFLNLLNTVKPLLHAPGAAVKWTHPQQIAPVR